MNPDLLSDSPTVATLNARAELRRLRLLVSDPPEGDTAGAFRAEIDRLEDVLSDALLADEIEGFVREDVVAEDYVTREDYRDVEKENIELVDENKRLKRELDGADAALAADPDEAKSLLAEARERVRELEGEVAKLAEQRDALKSPASRDAGARVRAALGRLHPGRRSKAKLELYEQVVAAVDAALKG